MSDQNAEYQRLRGFLNPAIHGPATDSVLNALAAATGPALIDNVTAVFQQMYIATASGEYLDQRLADYNLSRPASVGISDDVFRQIGLAVINKKQIRSLINTILTIIFGSQATQATMASPIVEPYALSDGQTLILKFDGGSPVTVVFNSSQFTDITNALAQEVADAITSSLSSQGLTGSAFVGNTGSGNFVSIQSSTEGPQSSVTVLGGQSQNTFLFPLVLPVVGSASTQWTVSTSSGSIARFTWTGGPDPSLGKAEAGDYVNIYGTNFAAQNRGTFTITQLVGGVVSEAYFEVENPNAVDQTATQGSSDGMLFFRPETTTVISNYRYAAVYQTSPNLLEIFIPATTFVVGRTRIGAAFLHDPSAPGDDPLDFGPYCFDPTQPFVISSVDSILTSAVSPTSGSVINVADASNFPDKSGYIMLGYGTTRQEGPFPYIGTPSSTSLLINPSYAIQQYHPVDENVSYISQLAPIQPAVDGSDYQFFVTDSISGRLYAEDLINTITATGINVVINVIYPNDVGLGKWGTQYSDKFKVWGPNEI